MDPLLSKRENMRQKHQEKRVSVTETPVPDSETAQKPETKKPKVELMSDEDFETFWKKYPIKEEKKKSKEKFLKLPKDLLQKILDSIDDHKARNEKWIKGFIKMPVTWINNECWNDEFPTFIINHQKNGING